MRSETDLVLCTDRFPFGNRSEPFLEPELDVLAERFRRIFLLPSNRDKGLRSLPDNVDLVEMPWLDGMARGQKLHSLCCKESMAVAASTLENPRNWRTYLKGHKLYLDLMAMNLIKYRMLSGFVREKALGGAVFYDYWFENSTLAVALLRRSGAIRLAVARAHGFDVYDERWDDLSVPFREFKLKWLDAVFPVSKAGSRYLASKVPAHREKVRQANLGVGRQERPSFPGDRIPSLVSCGSMIPIKRVHVIPRVLEKLGRAVRWTHLGDGPEMARIGEIARRMPPAVLCHLPGHLSHAEVLEFYRRNPVDAFFSVSESEGIPVSMMEALSFGVPVVATDVGGVSEIVTPETGILLPSEASVEDMARAVSSAFDHDRFHPETIMEFCRTHFDARRNYGVFCDDVLDLAGIQAAAL